MELGLYTRPFSEVWWCSVHHVSQYLIMLADYSASLKLAMGGFWVVSLSDSRLVSFLTITPLLSVTYACTGVSGSFSRLGLCYFTCSACSFHGAVSDSCSIVISHTSHVHASQVPVVSNLCSM